MRKRSSSKSLKRLFGLSRAKADSEPVSPVSDTCIDTEEPTRAAFSVRMFRMGKWQKAHLAVLDGCAKVYAPPVRELSAVSLSVPLRAVEEIQTVLRDDVDEGCAFELDSLMATYVFKTASVEETRTTVQTIEAARKQSVRSTCRGSKRGNSSSSQRSPEASTDSGPA